MLNTNIHFPRRLQNEIERYIDSPEIILITGLRRSGKTTLMKMLFEKIASDNKVFLDFENLLEQRLFDEVDFNNIVTNLKKFGLKSGENAFVFIDEVQNKPDCVHAIKYLFDHYKMKFLLTGSSSFYLKNLFPESLAGRKFIFELYPLDFEEFLIFKDRKKHFSHDFNIIAKEKNIFDYEKYKNDFEEYLYFGGFPQVTLAGTEEIKKKHLKDIFNSYFEKDVKTLADFRKMNDFRNLLFLLFPRIGSKLDISKLSRETSISRNTIYEYLYFLEATYFIHTVPQYSANAGKQVSKGKKIYFCDNGILNILARVSEGSLFENAVYLNLEKYGKIYYYQKQTGREIDFVIPEQNTAIEVKVTADIYDYKKLKLLSTPLNLKNSYVVSKNFDEKENIISGLDI